jgi:hypothetical protein
MVIFNSYVKLPQGNIYICILSRGIDTIINMCYFYTCFNLISHIDVVGVHKTVGGEFQTKKLLQL